MANRNLIEVFMALVLALLLQSAAAAQNAGYNTNSYPMLGGYLQPGYYPAVQQQAMYPMPVQGAYPRNNNQFYVNPNQQANAAFDAHNTAVKLLNKQEYAESIKYFQQAIRINPQDQQVHRSLALAYKGLHDYGSSLSELRIHLKVNQNDIDSYYLAGQVAQLQHNFSLASDLYAEYLRLKPHGHYASRAKLCLEILDHNYVHPDQDNYLDAATAGMWKHWETNGQPLKVFIADSSCINGFKPQYVPILVNAFNEWAIKAGVVQFEFTNNVCEAQITCSWTSEHPKGSDSAGLATVSMNADGSIRSAHIDLYTFPESKDSPVELANLARKVDLHEIGHALGLEHSKTNYDIMSPVAFPEGLDFPLSSRDIRTMIMVYSVPVSAMPNQ